MGSIWLGTMPKVLTDAGLDVACYPGWETRSRGSGGYEGILAVGVHHDASPEGTPAQNRWSYEWDVANDKPIGAMHLSPDGSIMIGAAGATNTQGKGGPYQCSKGTIPLNDGNRYMVSIEASNNGVGEVWPAVMQDAYATLCAALCDWLGLDPLRDVVAHFEWTDRKIDPAGNSRYATGGNKWNMGAFRTDIKNHGGVLPPPVGDDDMILVYAKNKDTGAVHASDGITRRYVADQVSLVRLDQAGVIQRDYVTGKAVKSFGDITAIPGGEIQNMGDTNHG